MEKFAPIPINLTDTEMAPADTNSRGFMTMVYENRLIALIIVLVVVLLCVLAYAFWRRDGGKPAERQSPYRRTSGGNNAPKPSREELERLKAELDSDDEYEEEPEVEPPQEHKVEPVKETRVEEPKNPKRELPPGVKLADEDTAPGPKIEEDKKEEPSEQITELVSESKIENSEDTHSKGGKVKCGNSICTRMVPESSGVCWQHRTTQK